MTMSSTGRGWIKLTSLLCSSHMDAKPFAINDIEFVEWSHKKIIQMHKYNIIENKWDEWIKLPDDVNDGYRFVGAVMFDKDASKLYFHSYPKFIECDIKHKTHHILYDKHFGGITDEGVIINGKYHIIAGIASNKHLIWNNEQRAFDIQHEFGDFDGMRYHRLIHLKSKKILLFIGGGNGNGIVNTIYSFNLDTLKWSKLPQILPNKMCNFGCIKSRNDQYILIFGGLCDGKIGFKTDKIYVLNTETMRFTESTIICPTKGCFRGINMNNWKKEELLNCGYIRNLWHLPQFNDIMYPPFYLVQIIGNYFNLEMIYLLHTEQGGHWKINIDEIISNCSK